MTLYDLKPAFQRLLRPAARRLDAYGVSANAVTLAAAAISVGLGLLLWHFGADRQGLFAILPVWLLLRMALNAIDGMLARDFGHQSRLGAYLNELADVVSDAALILPFAIIAPFSPSMVVLVVLLAALTEFAGVMGPMVGADRRYDGPLGKSDRALVLGILATVIAVAGPQPWFALVMPVMLVALGITVINRVRAGLATL